MGTREGHPMVHPGMSRLGPNVIPPWGPAGGLANGGWGLHQVPGGNQIPKDVGENTQKRNPGRLCHSQPEVLNEGGSVVLNGSGWV